MEFEVLGIENHQLGTKRGSNELVIKVGTFYLNGSLSQSRFRIYFPSLHPSTFSFFFSAPNFLHKAKITHKNNMGARVSLYSSLEVLGTKEAKLECLNRVQTPGLGFLPKQGLLAESGDRLAESKAWTPRLIPLLLGELVLQLTESKAKMQSI